MNVHKELLTKLTKDFKGVYSKEEIQGIVQLDSVLNDEVTLNTGTHLELISIRVVGEKPEEYGGAFTYERSFYPGINTLVSDNLSGKSSILKCVKYALTGRNSIKKDVFDWLDCILLEFKIGGVTYTSHIDNTGKRLKGALFRADLERFDSNDIRDIDTVFTASSKEGFEQHCESFFYKQLGVNSLKWTQKDSRKDVNRLNEAGTSWATFFKAIYLESKDSNSLIYGAQSELLFQIILGLGLTSAMNKLKVKKDVIQFEMSKNNDFREEASKTNKELLEDVNDQLEILKENLKKQKAEFKQFDTLAMIEEKSVLVKEIQALEGNIVRNIQCYSENEKRLASLQSKERKYLNNESALEQQKEKVQRSILRINEHIEIGSFFSNLEIKSCPNCNHAVTFDSSIRKSDSCDLCHNYVDSAARQEDVSRLEQKVILLEQECSKIDEQLSVIEKERNDIVSQIQQAKESEATYSSANDEERVRALVSDVDALERQINDVEQVNNEGAASIKNTENQIAVLEYRQEEAAKRINDASGDGGSDNTKSEVELLERAIQYLKDFRVSINSVIIEEFKEITLNVLHSLGLKSFSSIEVDDNLKISYRQGGNSLSFSEITEGEQLRVKIALYLALVQLNSEHGVGNHPRLLIIDSPGKEEADNKYFDGLIGSLNEVENNFSDKVQILIGTADRRLVNIVPDKKQEIIVEGESVF